MNDCYIYYDKTTLEEQETIIKQLTEDEEIYIFLRNGERINIYNYKSLMVDFIVHNNIEFITFYSNEIFNIDIITTRANPVDAIEKHSVYDLYIPCRLINEIS